MKTTTALALVLALAATAGCGSTRGTKYTPPVDLRGQSAEQIEIDTAECQKYAKKAEGPIAQKMLGDMLLGAKSASLDDAVELITKRCLAGRGYSVLN